MSADRDNREQRMWKAIRPILKAARLDPVRIESPISVGVPDVSIAPGWIELKAVERWPVRDGPLRVDHFTAGQRAWHIRRNQCGGGSWVLLRVGDGSTAEWLLFHGSTAAKWLGYSTKDELITFCVSYWTRKPKPNELKACLLSSF